MGKTKIALSVGKYLEKKLRPLFLYLKKIGLTANMATLSQIMLWPVILYFFYLNQVYIALGFVVITMLIDLLDGPFARVTKQETDTGYFVDKFTDMGSIIILLLGMMWAYPQSAILLQGLIVSLVVIYILNTINRLELWGGVRVVCIVGIILNRVSVFLFALFLVQMAIILYNLGMLAKRNLYSL